MTAGLIALGVWQLERRAWKLDLIARVDARIHAASAAFPWSGGAPQDLEYRRVRVTGIFDHARETLVQALTTRGAGFWVMTPLRTADGTILVNRGFVPEDRRDPARRAAGQVAGATGVIGLIRLSEPGGGFLRNNDPAAGRWYSRDVGAIAATKGLGRVAPQFVDADATPNPGGYPIGGLTIVAFRNTHLVYALTWFALAALAAFGTWLLWLGGRRA